MGWKNCRNIYSSTYENPHKYSEFGQMKDLQQTLKSMNAFLLPLVMSYVGHNS